MTRYFEYTGPSEGTRGEYGVNISGGHTTADDPEGISVFDPDFGDMPWGSVESGLESGDWVEIPLDEWEAL